MKISKELSSKELSSKELSSKELSSKELSSKELSSKTPQELKRLWENKIKKIWEEVENEYHQLLFHEKDVWFYWEVKNNT